ncbi:hypothetical protein C922_01992 [Plasmodium inui San Antonio 1]|uniref:Uncharacterized protein n=1 Tax=Plasmodium inui San Antonio 1 TaxID=1237626 RepID=W7A965_9APIC|nr:hypothetical protein C922_01992 [Plasmodium inui San Antonio 1]EUD67803.1 hypothetical protein C922_01992 [Plasmodium inui San Antonio 1]
MKKGEQSIPGKKAQGGKDENDLQRYMDELWGFAPNSGNEKEDIGGEQIGTRDKGVVNPSEESEGEANHEWGGKRVRHFHPRMLPHQMNHQDACVGRGANPICESPNGGTSSGNYSDGEGTQTTGNENVGKKGKAKKRRNHPNGDLTTQNEKDNFYPRNDKQKKEEEDRQKASKGTNHREDEEEAPKRRNPLAKETEANAVNNGKLNGWENPSYEAAKEKTKKHTPDRDTRQNRKNIFKEKMEAKKDFMNVVHEIRKLTLPHLDKFQKKIVENHQVKMLGGKFDKSPKVHYPELMFRKKSMKRYIQQRRERERIMGVKTQTGNYIDMQDVNRRKKRMKKEKTSSKLF